MCASQKMVQPNWISSNSVAVEKVGRSGLDIFCKQALACCFFMFAVLQCNGLAAANDSTPPPPRNPYMADSEWVMMHANGSGQGSTQWRGPSRGPEKLAKEHVSYIFTGRSSTLIPVFSGPYADGLRVIWNGAVDRVIKQDASTGRVIDQYLIEGVDPLSHEESETYLASLDAVTGDPTDIRQLIARASHFFAGTNPLRLNSHYHLIDTNNEFYVFTQPRTISVFGDSDRGKPDSAIALKREWTMPGEIGGILFALNMTYDGTLIATSTDGHVLALSRDFSEFQSLRLPHARDQGGNIMTAFLRNAQVIDPDGGIYITAGEFLYRVQWTGKKLSNETGDGAWTVAVPSEKRGHGSGTTPSLMGYGGDADKLLIIGDGSRRTNLLAVWRDRIPEDWSGIQDLPRRIAGSLPITFGLQRDKVELENSPNVAGYGVFIANVYPERRPPAEELSRLEFSGVSGFTQNNPLYQKYGAEKIVWNPSSRTLESAWTRPDLPLTDAIPAISESSGVVYGMGVRDGFWTLEALDWGTGENLFSTKVSQSHRFNPFWSPVTIGPDNRIFYNGPHGTVCLDFSGVVAQ